MITKTLTKDLNRLDTEAFQKAQKLPFAVVLEDVRSLNNVGSVFRTCDAFAAQELVLVGLTGCPPHLEIHKTALGAEDSVSWRKFDSIEQALSTLKNEGYTLVAVEQAKPHVLLQDWMPQPNDRYAFIFGSEVYGINQTTLEQCDCCLEIPQFGTKHSLNIAVSVGVVLWDFVGKYKKASM